MFNIIPLLTQWKLNLRILEYTQQYNILIMIVINLNNIYKERV